MCLFLERSIARVQTPVGCGRPELRARKGSRGAASCEAARPSHGPTRQRILTPGTPGLRVTSGPPAPPPAARTRPRPPVPVGSPRGDLAQGRAGRGPLLACLAPHGFESSSELLSRLESHGQVSSGFKAAPADAPRRPAFPCAKWGGGSVLAPGAFRPSKKPAEPAAPEAQYPAGLLAKRASRTHRPGARGTLLSPDWALALRSSCRGHRETAL